GLCGSLHVASFRDTACTGIYTLSLHDALPICGVKQFMRVVTVILLIMVGTVFVVGPAKILDDMTGNFAGLAPWLSIVFIYYVASTILPIDKLIGRIYPVFGFALLFMAMGIAGTMIAGGLPIPELTFSNLRK